MMPGEHDTGIFIKYATTLSSSNRTEQEPEPAAARLHIIITVNDAFSKETSFLCRHGANGGLRFQTRCYISPTSCLSLMTEKSPVTRCKGLKYIKTTILFLPEMYH